MSGGGVDAVGVVCCDGSIYFCFIPYIIPFFDIFSSIIWGVFVLIYFYARATTLSGGKTAR